MVNGKRWCFDQKKALWCLLGPLWISYWCHLFFIDIGVIFIHSHKSHTLLVTFCSCILLHIWTSFVAIHHILLSLFRLSSCCFWLLSRLHLQSTLTRSWSLHNCKSILAFVYFFSKCSNVSSIFIYAVICVSSLVYSYMWQVCNC